MSLHSTKRESILRLNLMEVEEKVQFNDFDERTSIVKIQDIKKVTVVFLLSLHWVGNGNSSMIWKIEGCKTAGDENFEFSNLIEFVRFLEGLPLEMNIVNFLKIHLTYRVPWLKT